jgi:FkbM family methyltransferase
MIINSKDLAIGRGIETAGHWALHDIELLKNICNVILESKSNIVFYDVGANIGTHSVPLAKEFGDKIQVRAFEAQRQVYYMLCGNIAVNGLRNVHCYHVAAGDQNTTMDIQLPDYSVDNNFGGLELMPPQFSDNQNMIKHASETVDVIKLDNFDETVDIIKLDVEGMEHLVVQGAATLIKRGLPVCLVEVFKTDKSAVSQFFKNLNYRAYEIREGDWLFVHQDSDICIHNAQEVVL